MTNSFCRFCSFFLFLSLSLSPFSLSPSLSLSFSLFHPSFFRHLLPFPPCFSLILLFLPLLPLSFLSSSFSVSSSSPSSILLLSSSLHHRHRCFIVYPPFLGPLSHAHIRFIVRFVSFFHFHLLHYLSILSVRSSIHPFFSRSSTSFLCCVSSFFVLSSNFASFSSFPSFLNIVDALYVYPPLSHTLFIFLLPLFLFGFCSFSMEGHHHLPLHSFLRCSLIIHPFTLLFSHPQHRSVFRFNLHLLSVPDCYY